MTPEIKILGPGDEELLKHVAAEVFDNDVSQELSLEFLKDARHHIVVAIEQGVVVGFVSAVDYVHPDKPVELWINELAVAPPYQRQGIAKQLLQAIFKVGHERGCKEAWVLTERSNRAAMKTYSSGGGLEDEGKTVMFTFFLSEGEGKKS